ncbi:MAG: hypothetical protein KatS3mg001_238 [Candidatus Pacearchaeota archaeon]|nr:MAG: hypothetical protein KatS3mg001_238 [Candidatus Pacearchaeota archaeon]
MILKGLFQNKKGLIQKSMTLIFIAFALFALIFLVYNSKYASAAKSDQFFIGNFTCESFEDALLWSAVGQKSAPTNSYFGWVPAVGCNSSINTVGPKACDIHKIQSFVRYSNIGTANSLTTGQVYAQIANTTQSNETNPSSANFTLARYFARLNETVVAGDVLGPRYECGIASDTTSINRTCQVNGSGYDNSTFNYSVRLFADGAANGKTRALIDVFNIKYDWCWTPIIYDAVVTPDIADNETTFTFTINVTNPGATTNVSLFTAPLGSNEWVQEGATQTCIDCAQKKLTFNVNFGNRIGKRIFKFNATDGTYGTEAGNPAHLGTATNECLDTDNDCQFEVTQAAAAQGTPNIINETVNGVQSGAVEGWGTNWTFSVNVSNPPDGAGDINVTLFVNTGSGFIQKASANCTAPCSSSTKFTFFVDDFQCSDISSAQYRFTATNLNGTTTVTHPFTIERDDVIIEHIQGNNSIANRSGNQIDLLIVRVFDSDKAPSGAYIGSGTNVTFNVKFDDVNFDAGTNRTTNSSGYANYSFDPTCSPTKYQVGNREWKASTSGDSCYKDVTSSILNLSIAGDIILTFNEPDGSSNFTQEDEITFLGATTDDCGDALVTTVKYYANSSEDSFACTSTTQIGANAFQCVYTTSLSDTRGYYNTTMLANRTLHYDNQTSNVGNPGLFYLFPRKKLTNPTANPTAEGWGKPNWNFSVLASSGDIDNVLQVNLFMAQSVNPTTQCTSPTCQNQTPIICDAVAGCSNQLVTYYRNFTASDQGTWFFQFKFNDTELTSTSGTEFSVVVEKDDTNISYGGQGNATTVIKDTQPQNLSVRVFDLDKNSYNVTLPSANVTFKLLDPGYAGGEKIIGYALTNETGHATFLFNVTECNFQQGTQKWIGEILSTEPNYKPSKSENFTITINLPGCEATVSVENVITPTETFQNINFTINSTIAAFISTANDVNVTLNVPSGWIVGPSATQSLGSVVPGTPKTVSWTVNATSYGRFNVSVFANSSDAGNDTLDSSNFQVYKEELKGTALSPTLPSIVQAGGNITASWQCSVGDYRVATLNINANTSSSPTTIRVLTYNGTDFVDVLHSKSVDTNNTIKTIKVPLLSKQIDSNETGFCNVKIFNLGSNSINITDISLEAYYNETVSVRDVQASVNGVNTTGIESSETLFNVSAILANSINQSFLANVTLNITNSSGVVFTSTNNNINIPALGSIQTNFININTSNWSVGNYSIEVYAVGNFTKANNKTEILIFNNVEIYADSTKYICNSTTETFNVTIFHPFTDTIQYNISLEMPSGWSYSGAQTVNISTIGNHSFIFNITSSNAAAENATINATINYSYPGINKLKKTSFNIEEGNNIPILEIIRESPRVVSSNTEFVSRLIVYNKGCALANSISLTEKVSSGWTAYTPSIDGVLGGIADIPKGEIRYTENDLGTIRAKEYKVLSYFIFSPSGLNEIGKLRYNLTWGSRNNYEPTEFTINTSKYTKESHLSYNIRAVGSFKDRSAEKDENQLYEFNVTNIGDFNITNATWNVSLSIPNECSPSNYTGIFNSTTRKITWPLGTLNVSNTKSFFLNLNCTVENRFVLVAEGTNDTRTQTSFSNNTGIGCSFSSGNECSSVSSFTFSKPSNARYEKLSSVNATIFYNFTDFKMTVGEGAINFSDDFNKFRILWQNYSITTPDGTSGTVVANYTLDSSEQDSFVNSARNIGVRAYVDATSSAKGNVTLQKIDYTWDHGKLFNESQNLFIDIHPFIFDLPTPVLQTPLNNSLQAAVPVGLSWEAISAPQGINITYYVFGDSTNASTLLDVITENLYLWRDLGATQGTFYWKVIASDGTQNKSSEIRQFTLDLCQPNTNFAFALNYPMSYNLTTDTITVWGSNGTGFTAMGNNESNPITFKNIFEFGQAVRGVCAVTNPSSGSYVILSRLELGNVTDPLNTTFVKTTGESLSFNKQLQLNFNATLISGQLTQGGSPFGGSTLSFSGLDAVNQEEGEFYLKPGSKLRLYDTGVLHTITANNSNPFRLYWNGDVIAKASTLQNWYTIRFLGSNNTIDNLILTNMGEGFFPAATQIGVLTNIRPSGIQKGGLMLEGNANSTITSLEVQEATNDILVQNYTGTTNLINANLNFSNINWTTGTFSGKINRKYDYEPTVTDSAGIPISNTSMVLLDTRGEIIFDLFTDSLGKIPKQTITRAIYDYNFKTGDDRGPHTLKIKKYGKTFQSLAKQFSAATIETLQLTNNPFINRTEAQAKNQTGIKFNPPIRVPYGAEIYQNFNTTGKLNNSPITQSEFFAVFGFDGVNENRKLTLVTGSPSANGEFSVNYATGELIFFNDQTGHNVTPVYSYGGNITISTGTASQNCISMSNLYDYMQANLSDVITTVDGITYTMFVNLIIGNNTVGGCIVDPKASIVFEDGYTYSFSPIGGYIDLAGITAGGGTSGSGINPLSIVDSVGSQYNPGDVVDVFSTTYESSTGNLIDATVNVTIFYPNNSILVSGISNKISTGFYKFNTTLPDNSPLGTYGILIRANDSSGNVVNDVLSFKVEQKQISSGFALNMFNTIGSTYGFGDVVKLFTTTVNSSGNLVNSTVNVAVFYPNNTLLNSGQSSLVSTGRFEYSFIAPTVEGTYRINVDANYSGNEAHDTESFIISATSSGGSVSTPQIYVEAPSVVNVNTNFSIVSLINSESGIPVNCDSGANLTIKDSLNGVNVLNETPMTNFALGLYNYTYLASTPSSYLAIVDCIISNVEYKGIKAFSTQGVPLPKKAVVEMSDFDEVLAGKNFRAKIWIFDQNGVPINADSTPTITLYDPLRNIIVQNVSMTQISTGIYEYNFTTSSGLTGGVWEAIANVVVNGINYQPSDFWELESSPAQVKINSIVDNTIPTITADVTITNEGSGAQEYQYEYCIVSEQTNQCGGDDDIDYASGAKLLNPGESFNTLLTLDGVTSPGDYYFKIVVYFGTEKSGASQLFTAVEEGAPTPAPAPSAPSGGGGGAAPITPPEIVKEEKPTGKLYLFNLNIDIISLRALTLLQNSIETNKEFLTSKQIFIDFSSLNPTRDELILETKTNITDFSSIKGEKDVVLEHSIEDPNGKVYVSSFETRKINNSEIVIKEIKIPARLLSVGNYLVVAKLTYNNETFIGRDVFAIVSKEPEAKIESISIWILIIVLILSIILVITIIRLIIKKQAYKRKIEQRLQEKESLKKVERYIKE